MSQRPSPQTAALYGRSPREDLLGAARVRTSYGRSGEMSDMDSLRKNFHSPFSRMN
jgi:hypothetical protein